MGEDWEKLAGEKGEEVTSSRLKRMFKLGTMGARVGASTVASKVGSLLPGDKDRRQDRLARSYAKNAERVVDVLGQLKGASMKVGQLLSADPELMPDEFADVMASLQKDAPPMTYNTVRSQIEQSLDRPIEAVFSYFDPDPIGSASIGQVHRATLEDGQPVAVKVQYPGVADSLVSDLKSLKTMLVYGRAFVDRERLDTIFEEVQRMLMQEADYELEAESLARFHEALKQRDGLRAPRAYRRWSSKEVLVMEFVEGVKLDEALVEMGPGPRRDDLLKRWVQTYSWMFHELLELHADPHPGNFILQDDDTLVMLDFGCVKSFDAAFADGFLDILDATWQGDAERLVELYLRLGFGAEGTDAASIDPELMQQYQEIVVAPFLRDEAFDFSGWEPAKEGKLFMLRHPSFLKLVPPPDALAYFRVLSGIKGLLGKLDAEINVYRAAYETARRRGRLTQEQGESSKE